MVGPSVTHAIDKPTCQRRPVSIATCRDTPRISEEEKTSVRLQSQGLPHNENYGFQRTAGDVWPVGPERGVDWDPWSLYEPVRFPWGD